MHTIIPYLADLYIIETAVFFLTGHLHGLTGWQLTVLTRFVKDRQYHTEICLPMKFCKIGKVLIMV